MVPGMTLTVINRELPVLVGLSHAEIEGFLAGLGEPAYRGRQVAQWIYQQSARTFDEMTDLPAALRARLAVAAAVGRSEVTRKQVSSDGTTKLLLRYPDGREIETVVLPFAVCFSVCR